jgi:uncharacterized protein
MDAVTSMLPTSAGDLRVLAGRARASAADLADSAFSVIGNGNGENGSGSGMGGNDGNTSWLKLSLAGLAIAGLGSFAASRIQKRRRGVPVQDSCVWVSGASSGIGYEIALESARRGARVIVGLGRRSAQLDALGEAIARARRGGGGDFETKKEEGDDDDEFLYVPLVVDLSDREATVAAVTGLLDTHGVRVVPDVVFHSAGQGAWKFCDETSDEDFRAMTAAPFTATFNLVNVLSQPMMDACLDNNNAKRAHVLLQSPAALGAVVGATGYTANRWALRGLYEALRWDFHGTGVNVCHFITSEADTPYFATNPGAADRIPAASRFMFGPPVKAPNVASAAVNAAEAGSKEVIYPLRLAITMATDYWPGSEIVRWLMWRTSPVRRS